MYLTVIIDLYHRKIVGWSMSNDFTTENTIMKVCQMSTLNNPINKKLIFHSDRGIQYASQEFRKE
ncbi:IS3 family transposase [Aquimarina agarilytica]|uniref:IS3 family transposase n=1 Tax=Aquimarina agarilytica TaxID=1087449 RepID=UPI000288319D